MIPAYRLGHRVTEGPRAVSRATIKQRQSYHRLRRRASIRGVILLSNGVLQVGFERLTGRHAEAYIDRDGSRLATENSLRR